MCLSAPKPPAVPAIPDRRASVLPDAGDPSVRIDARRRRALMPSLMIFSNQSTLGAPSTGSPSSTGT